MPKILWAKFFVPLGELFFISCKCQENDPKIERRALKDYFVHEDEVGHRNPASLSLLSIFSIILPFHLQYGGRYHLQQLHWRASHDGSERSLGPSYDYKPWTFPH